MKSRMSETLKDKREVRDPLPVHIEFGRYSVVIRPDRRCYLLDNEHLENPLGISALENTDIERLRLIVAFQYRIGLED